MGRTLFASLCITGVLLSAASTATFAIEVLPAPGTGAQMVSLGKGDRVPPNYALPESAFTGWKAAGLKQPDIDSQWVQMGDNFVLVRRGNAVIQDIQPIPK